MNYTMKSVRDWPFWKAFAVFFVAAALVSALVGIVVDRANGATGVYSRGIHDTSQRRICTPNPPPDEVCTVAQWNAYFIEGKYNRNPANLTYSDAFHDMFMQAANDWSDAHPKWNPCPGTGNLGCTWSDFKAQDTCGVKPMPDSFDADSCRASNGLPGLLDSPYWTKRGALQDKWTTRILWCGVAGVIIFRLTNGSAGATLGAGSGWCMGDKVVP